MRKFILPIAALLLSIFLVGCGNGNSSSSKLHCGAGTQNVNNVCQPVTTVVQQPPANPGGGTTINTNSPGNQSGPSTDYTTAVDNGRTSPGSQSNNGSVNTSRSAPASAATGTGLAGPITDSLLDGRSFDSRTQAVDPNLGVPGYDDTGIGQPKSWDIEIKPGYTMIVGGVTLIDDLNPSNNRNDGFIFSYRGHFKGTVVDGFYKIVANDRAYDEYCTRLRQHRDPNNHWASRNLVAPDGKDPNCGT
ncbi:MAG TPA: hypothetical protein VG965_02370 [Patescibacteria group bacterium]|nr:hypothetical protein [Patescibacteria group bacterium]